MSHPDEPQPPSTSLDDGAVVAHEMYLSLRRAGFGRWAALWLTACLNKAVPLPDWFADKLRDAEPEEGQ